MSSAGAAPGRDLLATGSTEARLLPGFFLVCFSLHMLSFPIHGSKKRAMNDELPRRVENIACRPFCGVIGGSGGGFLNTCLKAQDR